MALPDLYAGKMLALLYLHEKLSTTNMEAVKQDVRGFIFNQRDIEIWSNDYFLKLADMIVFKE